MARQNLISGVVAPAEQQVISEQIATIHTRLNFGVSLTPKQIQSLSKAGDQMTPFLEKAVTVALSHPEILSRDFDEVEYKKDADLMHALVAIEQQVQELHEMLRINIIAAKSDLYAASREVYEHVGSHADKTPGLNATIADLAAFFKRNPRTKPPVPPTA